MLMHSKGRRSLVVGWRIWQRSSWREKLVHAEDIDNPALLDVKQKWDKDGLDIVDLLDKTARDPALGLAFNYASLLLNNSFFLEGMVRFISGLVTSSRLPIVGTR